MPRGRLKRELEHVLVRILFDGRLRLLRLGLLPGDADIDGWRVGLPATPQESVAQKAE